MDISIFGLGYVGCVSLGCLAKNGHKVIGVDINPHKVQLINSGKPTIIEAEIEKIIKEGFKQGRISATQNAKEAVISSEISIIAVGTPSSPKGHLNLNHVLKVAEEIADGIKEKDDFHIVAVRSTVLPGTCDKIEAIIENVSGKTAENQFTVISNPEFLREGTAVYDYFNPPYTLVGSKNKEQANNFAKLYDSLDAELIITETKTAELIKYVNNSFHALKIGFANEVGNICKEIGIDSHKVMDIFSKDKKLNISAYYLKPGFAYGGSCLPKDLKALQTISHDSYLKTPILESIEISNENQIQRAIDVVMAQKKKKLGILGLSFKAGTDDLRNSPIVTLIEVLLGKGFKVKIYDRNVHISRLIGANKEFIDAHIPHLTKLITDNIQYVIDASEVIVVGTNEKEFIPRLEKINNKIIIDLVRISELLIKKRNYIGINW